MLIHTRIKSLNVSQGITKQNEHSVLCIFSTTLTNFYIFLGKYPWRVSPEKPGTLTATGRRPCGDHSANPPPQPEPTQSHSTWGRCCTRRQMTCVGHQQSQLRSSSGQPTSRSCDPEPGWAGLRRPSLAQPLTNQWIPSPYYPRLPVWAARSGDSRWEALPEPRVLEWGLVRSRLRGPRQGAPAPGLHSGEGTAGNHT